LALAVCATSGDSAVTGVPANIPYLQKRKKDPKWLRLEIFFGDISIAV
jgi:hypothetical protein